MKRFQDESKVLEKLGVQLPPLPPTPKVSTVIPAFNAAAFITEAVESALNQTYGNLEIIVVNDGSTDGTRDKIKQYGSRIRYVEQANRGPAAARNHGVQIASGSLITFLDADDVWLPEKIRRQVEYMASHSELGIVTTDVLTFGDQGIVNGTLKNYYPISNGFVLEKLLFHNWIGASAAMVRRECFDRVGGFDEILTPDGRGQCTAEDWLMWMKIASHYPVHFIDEVLVRHRIHASNYSTIGADVVFEHLLENLKIMERTIPQLRQRPQLLRQAASRICRIRGWEALSEIRTDSARRKFRKGLEYTPFSLKLWFLFLLASLPEFSLRVLKRSCKEARGVLNVKFLMHI